MTGDQLREAHAYLVLNCIPELARLVDPARRDMLALIVVAPRSTEMEIGFASGDAVIEDLLAAGTAWGSPGVRQFAADLATGTDAKEGHLHCVVVAGGLATCTEYQVELLRGG
jgi:hypothetical protein